MKTGLKLAGKKHSFSYNVLRGSSALLLMATVQLGAAELQEPTPWVCSYQGTIVYAPTGGGSQIADLTGIYHLNVFQNQTCTVIATANVRLQNGSTRILDGQGTTCTWALLQDPKWPRFTGAFYIQWDNGDLTEWRYVRSSDDKIVGINLEPGAQGIVSCERQTYTGRIRGNN